jgi:hypothetical protein
MIRTLTERVAETEKENTILQRWNDNLLLQIEDLQYQLKHERDLFARLTLLETPPAEDDTQSDLPAVGE